MALQTYTSAPETPITYAQNANITFEMNGENSTSQCVIHSPGAQTVTIKRAGLYLVTFDGIVANNTSASGNVGVQLFSNGNAVAYAKSVATSGSATDVVPLQFSTYVRVLPSCASINNTTTLTVSNVGVEANYFLSNLMVARVSN